MLTKNRIAAQLFDKYYSRPDLSEGDRLSRRFRLVDPPFANWVIWSAVFQYEGMASEVAELVSELPVQGYYYVRDEQLFLLVPKLYLGDILHLILYYDFVPEAVFLIGLRDEGEGA